MNTNTRTHSSLRAPGPIARRHFLRGAGGASLALPWLPSLDSRAFGADAVVPNNLRFAAFMTEHGGIAESNMYPAKAYLTTQTQIFPGHSVRSGSLAAAASTASGITTLSPVLKAASAALSPKVIGQMNVLHGLDIPFYIGHHQGGHLGNFGKSDQGPQNLMQVPTIDQVMAWSPSFYRELGGVRMRTIITGMNDRNMSFGYSNPAAGTGGVQGLAWERNSSTLFDKLFAGAVTAPTPTAPRKSIVDRVVQGYKDTRTNARLSMADRQRLDDHVDRMSELQRSLTSAPTRSCGMTAKPADSSGKHDSMDPGELRKFFGLQNEIIALAFTCGASRIATIPVLYGFRMNFMGFGGDWHQEVAHTMNQSLLTPNSQKIFEFAVLDLVNRLNVEEANGRTYLDNSLVQWTQEAGITTHDAWNMPLITFGSAGGRLKTGNFIDYRNVTPAGLKPFNSGGGYAGLLHRQWLATALQAMGVSRQEFERNGQTGYGATLAEPWYTKGAVAEVFSGASDMMPLL